MIKISVIWLVVGERNKNKNLAFAATGALMKKLLHFLPRGKALSDFIGGR